MRPGFNLTGDFVRGHSLANLGALLDKGVKVALVYGDRDYQCNWLGGEAISLAIKSNSTSSFVNAGYANIETNSSYVGGLVRQHGNLSFSRVFQAGHEGMAHMLSPTAFITSCTVANATQQFPTTNPRRPIRSSTGSCSTRTSRLARYLPLRSRPRDRNRPSRKARYLDGCSRAATCGTSRRHALEGRN
jgi:Serine carboxypeptidase